jgi:cellulose synthase/poly-beta-1,6-N-acetylglucosamine synthase-like glycosyltransferase
MYIIVVVALLVTAYFIWVEGFYALRPLKPFETPGEPYPPATAIIAAYLPNEAATIVETVEAFLNIEYPNSLQVLLAYNTPKDHPIEAKLRQIAERSPRFTPYRVMSSTSKAQNVNAALAESRGEFIGIFDADHHPAPDSFVRAWHWLSNGFDVVQGHCLVRNGDASWVARTVAVEFEAIYAVSHPGRARLHDFGIFGGSNGYWRAGLLRRIRMRGSMLTEDIDSSMRVIESGGKIVADPFLVSRELAPTTLSALWHQRMRWAQGWFQVTWRHVVQGLRSPHLSIRQKIGLWYLLMWREVYPWISLQMFPIVAYWAWQAGGVSNLDWFVRLFVLTTLFTLSTGPGQTLFAYLLAAPDIRQHPRWFVAYLMVSSLFYTEFKNTISRVAQLKELSRERQWKVTPRSAEAKEASG